MQLELLGTLLLDKGEDSQGPRWESSRQFRRSLDYSSSLSSNDLTVPHVRIESLSFLSKVQYIHNGGGRHRWQS